jgi:hypothetical protein
LRCLAQNPGDFLIFHFFSYRSNQLC